MPKKAAKTDAQPTGEAGTHTAVQEETADGTVYYLDAAARDRVKARTQK